MGPITTWVVDHQANPHSLGSADDINRMMDVWVLASAFATTESGDIDSWIRSQPKGLATAVATLFPKLPIVDVRRNGDDAGLTVLSAASRFLNVTTTADAQLRLVSVFGVLSSKLQLCEDSARIPGDTIIAILGVNGGSDAVKMAAQQA
ncbi:hypothetical protein EV175_006995, partial [Coemansia sp. RSA 1933]